ncbi:hypothetical protein AB4455_01185 [Vibrio sp. 10N.261.46.E12]|jgi:hypothetical protein|uniref:Uncharacterized protein n=2 Tax=Vibrio TaxID=662 RepID=A0A0H3ZKD6_9VIBR|nr:MULTISPECIES: hypothetical protein [Vibrio]AKN36493.1 hypothetical protein [Vibrio tasmaniensis]CAH7149672.1 conserved hypothetical protein [Vibrio chagasii]PML89261.1 hypothetical protein BCT66_07895 [Vibrio sp. 10N.261.49.E11]PMM23124.1 hypothetical protein BCT58_14315 [Vibrio lentus]PMN80311.1 hypothetical protein BCT25_01985 [Vibrio sp. 10N.261.45.A6]
MDNDMDTVKIPTEKLVEFFLHTKQFEQHYATQESVDNLKESVRELKSDTNKRFDKLEGKLDRLQWFLVASVLAILFQDKLALLFI